MLENRAFETFLLEHRVVISHCMIIKCIKSTSQQFSNHALRSCSTKLMCDLQEPVAEVASFFPYKRRIGRTRSANRVLIGYRCISEIAGENKYKDLWVLF